ncbi:unnamed protein product [Lepidochelys olivacea]
MITNRIVASIICHLHNFSDRILDVYQLNTVFTICNEVTAPFNCMMEKRAFYFACQHTPKHGWVQPAISGASISKQFSPAPIGVRILLLISVGARSVCHRLVTWHLLPLLY